MHHFETEHGSWWESNPEEKAKVEVEAYLRVIEQDVKGHPLHWWKDEERKYPILASLAKKYM